MKCILLAISLSLFGISEARSTVTHVTLTCYQPDVMNKRHKHRIDILIHPKDCKRISVSNVKVKIL